MKISGTNQKLCPDIDRPNTDLWMDSKGKEVREQITDAKNRLKELSTDTGLNEEEREKKRKEIQQKITELNKQLRQRQIELQREQQEQKRTSAAPTEDKTLSNNTDVRKKEPPSADSTHTGTKAIIAAASAIGQAQSQGSLASSLESQLRVLQAEIKQDKERGRDTSIKQEELKKLESKVAKLNRTGISLLEDAAKEIRKAAIKDTLPEKKSGRNNSDGFVRLLKSPLSSAPKSKTDIYIKGDMFSHVDFHF